MKTNTPESKPWTVIVLAAGQGKRMKSPLPKVLHPVAGLPLIHHVIESCHGAGLRDIRLVAGVGLPLVKQVVEPLGVQVFVQNKPQGTGDAVRAARPEELTGNVMILNGDHPLVQPEDLRAFITQFEEDKLDLMLVTTILKDPKSFGRIVRSGGQMRAIVEAKDASAETLKIKEVNTGIYLCKADLLAEQLPKIKNNNAQGEYYLTDVVSMSIDDGDKVGTCVGPKHVSVGVNNQLELARASRWMFAWKARKLMEEGVVIVDPRTAYIEKNAQIGPGSVVMPNVTIRGKSRIGAFVSIEPNCYINDSVIADSVQIRANTYLESVKIGLKASIGPFARLRPDTEIGEDAHVGNFVEMKKVKFGNKSKAGHLTYLGDAEIGQEVNIGCGTITCNYAVDKKKYKTYIGDRTFVGSDSQFVAPVRVGADAVIGSGSTITKDVPDRGLGVARAKQFTKENYVKIPDANAEVTARPKGDSDEGKRG
ncbi:MAG: bifunctional UDP-N-acetylglucosamine diphosphorylase/glucosamine-1-phosphate N-acetyltransferase GlmU [Bdellovibrionaceae bacterium]|nr:bifunctional UDP-N-acetylglucosamine diphosphorylase/glucosamine-1-phosphate N-acetyltransferase GlmU [Pseudobdellovibrionaceae bacterium]